MKAVEPSAGIPPEPPVVGDHLRFFLASVEFSTTVDPTGRYLALLAWVARHYAGDFADFLSHQESGRHYLMLGRDAINAVRLHNRAEHLAGTPYWAVMTIGDDTRRRFTGRLLEFIGCHDETVALADQALGFDEAPAGGRQLSA